MVFIDINEHTMYVFSGNKLLSKFSIASGKPETPSPIGDFTIIQKSWWGEGFGSAWLGLDVPWGIYGIHGTTKPEYIGTSVSHGCIRMNNSDVDKLYKIVRVGTPVKIVNGPYGMMGNGFRTLVPGDRGADVLIIQKKLKELGFYKGITDGIYGTATEKSLYDFQKSKNIPISNIITINTYNSLGITLFE